MGRAVKRVSCLPILREWGRRSRGQAREVEGWAEGGERPAAQVQGEGPSVNWLVPLVPLLRD
jgi:hypothetical protein